MDQQKNDFSIKKYNKIPCVVCGKICLADFEPRIGQKIYCRDCSVKRNIT